MVFYDVDLRNAKLREFAFGVPWYLMPLIALMKLVRARFQGTTDDPPVETLLPFEVEESALPEEVRAGFEPLAKDLETLGFTRRVCHAIDYHLHATRVYFASFSRDDGRAWARLHCRIWTSHQAEHRLLFPMFFSRLDDDSFLVSSSGKPDMEMPNSVRMVNEIGADVSRLWDRHNRELVAERPRQPTVVDGVDGLRDAMQRHHERLRDYLLQRGIFQPLPDATQRQLAGPAVPPTAHGEPAPHTVPPEDIAVHLALQHLQNDQSTWRGKLGLLAVSLLLFVVAFSFLSVGEVQETGGLAGFRDRLWWIIPVLAFHELGHYLAMRWFGYRNVRMFFIPFLGAAVSGKHYNVLGWKKAVVALMGPVPGIVLGLAVGAVGLYYNQLDLKYLCGFLLVLNGLQLLPLLPLDGGWVVHAVLFARHPVLEAVFRVLAAAALLGIGILLGDYVLMILGGIMLIAAPAAWRMAAAADRLRRQGSVLSSPDGHTIPSNAVTTILAELRATSKGQVPPALLAQQVVGVYEMLNARPPGVIGSLGLLAVHFGSLTAAIILPVLALVVMHWGPFRDRNIDHDVDQAALAPPSMVYRSGETATWRGPKAPDVTADKGMILAAHFDQQEAARERFHSLQKEVPSNATLRWFGSSVLLTLVEDQVELRQRWKDRLQQSAQRVTVDLKASPAIVRLHCVAQDEETARRIETELRGYLTDDYLLRPALLPPWSSAWRELPAEERERFGKARRTLSRLYEVTRTATQAQEVQRLQNEMGELFRQRKPEAIREQMEKIHLAIDEERQRLVTALRAEADPNLDPEVIDSWLVITNRSKPQPGDKKAAELATREQARLRRQLAQRLGAFPLMGEAPAPASNRESINYGGTERRQGARIELEGFTFTDIAEGLPALAEWMSRQGCTGLTYDVTNPDIEDDQDPNKS